ncbi:small GTP-binding protein domain [Vavraia culicis subsp. floridensis]|uniref:Small GTP-binding protein domain n=1 Tax=Vavraia culicis (isolate floridensis) TaxID=948595 RepID=L2GT25_VAVCU|nr:small GTP-binding protein domain [Vavraia culicis subsp. floridensis]ELA46517.1 small GTP-binding protein domain [Vavraia culicis subsp. floridensis]
MAFNFKAIKKIPLSLIDVVLSKTQRKTPTVIRNKHPLPKIRSFYTRKVKFTGAEYAMQLETIINSFPHVEDIHPFYNDLINVLYDKSHFKMALGHLNSTKKNVESITNEYVRLIKYGTSLYGCKQLKRAGLGKMTSLVKRLKPTLEYLEEVRQHMSRLPQIDPECRTVLLCGLPNTGKSSFMNCVSKAHVDVQPYAFTTRSLFVGHFEYNYLSWQIVDTPGVLDHALEEMNTIEMQSVTALAHLNSIVLFFLDVSEQCGYSVDQQISLYNSIAPLIDRRMLIVLSKCDLKSPSTAKSTKIEHLDLKDEIKYFLDGKQYAFLSVFDPESVEKVKRIACDSHLEKSLEIKLQKNLEPILNRINVHEPPSHRPKEECMLRSSDEKIITERDLAKDNLDYYFDENKNYLVNEDEKYDVMPEIYNGKNVMDFVDVNILDKVESMDRYLPIRDYDVFDDNIKKEIDKRIRVKQEHTRNKLRATLPERFKNNPRKKYSTCKEAEPKKRGPKQFVEKQKPMEYDRKPKHLYR